MSRRNWHFLKYILKDITTDKYNSNIHPIYHFIDENNYVTVKPLIGFYTKVDLGIVKYHFEIGSNKKL